MLTTLYSEKSLSRKVAALQARSIPCTKIANQTGYIKCMAISPVQVARPLAIPLVAVTFSSRVARRDLSPVTLAVYMYFT